MEKDSSMNDLLNESSAVNGVEVNSSAFATSVDTSSKKRNVVSIVVLVVAVLIILGVIFYLSQSSEKLHNLYPSDDEYVDQEERTSLIGKWYSYDGEDYYVIHLKNTNKCSIGLEQDLEVCSYIDDDNTIRVFEGETGYLEYDAEYVEFSYTLHSSYLELEMNGSKVNFYSTKDKATKNYSNALSNADSNNTNESENSFEGILNKYSKEEFVKICKNIDYTSLARTPDNYVGEYIHFKGKVIQVQEDNNENIAVLRVDTKLSDYDYSKNDYVDDTVYVVVYNYDMNYRILEDDIIDMYGIYYGIETYETVMDSTISIPAMVTLYFSIE